MAKNSIKTTTPRKSKSLNEFQRQKPTRLIRQPVLISLEDEKSARHYFSAIQAELRQHRIVVVADYKGSAPKSVVKAAKDKFEEQQRLAEKDDFEQPFEKDHVWVVFDTEGPQNEVRRRQAAAALDQCRALGFQTAISNPTFEYWLLLHFEYSVSVFADGKAVVTRLRSHVKDYDKELSKDVRKHTGKYQNRYRKLRTGFS